MLDLGREFMLGLKELWAYDLSGHRALWTQMVQLGESDLVLHL